MMIRNGYVLLAAATLALASGVASCGNDDPPTGDGIDYTEKVVTGYRMQYNMNLADPNVREVADVLVTYFDAEGKEVEDTMDGQEWQKTVVMPSGKEQTYGLAARFASKQSPVMSQDEYDFAVDLTSGIYTLYSNGSAMMLAWATNRESQGILKADADGEYRTTRSASYLVTPQAREDMDTTLTYFNFTNRRLESGRDTIIFNKNDFKK